VIKVITGENWDPLFEKDKKGVLKKRLTEAVDGERQRYTLAEGDYIREKFFGTNEELKKLVENLSDEEITKLRRGGHDPLKVFNAFNKAVNSKNRPTVILHANH
jgi:pyruvate dehydrogenase E1 component